MWEPEHNLVIQQIRMFAKQWTVLIKLRGCVQKFPDWVDNEIYAYNNERSLRSDTKGYGGKTH